MESISTPALRLVIGPVRETWLARATGSRLRLGVDVFVEYITLARNVPGLPDGATDFL